MFKANDAAHAVLADPDPALIPHIIEILRRGKRVYNRIEAAYALQFLGGNAKTIIALERALSNKSKSPKVRAFAAESLALNHRKRSHSVLLRNLKDTSSDVRFWCAYALGEMHDRAVKGWWKVSKEARDAIKNIEGNRKRKCLFCKV